MATYLLDTNILLRGADDTSGLHVQAKEAVKTLLAAGHACFMTGQVLVEFWAVATRPVRANGLGWDIGRTTAALERLLAQFPMLDEVPGVFLHWQTLVSSHAVKGKRVHDVRLLAVMQVHGTTHLLTYNSRDFPEVDGIHIIEPQTVS